MKTIAIFDIGKTNKKLLLFNEKYEVVYQYAEELAETEDEDGFPCEDLAALQVFLKTSFEKVQKDPSFEIVAVNFSGYGASFVYLDENGAELGPLYNYLKPFSEGLRNQLIQDYGSEESLSPETASPFLGNLNSGLQPYRLKNEKPDFFRKIKNALHFPQYLAYTFGAAPVTELTSIGCHTRLWDFKKNQYHQWVQKEGLADLFPPIQVSDTVFEKNGLLVGVGLHDSSSALIPYLKSFSEPFILISTGTWSICLNPFNASPLTEEQLQQDCLSFISFEGHQVKASRLFAGQMHEDAVNTIAKYFEVKKDFFKSLRPKEIESKRSFEKIELNNFKTPEEAYTAFMEDLIEKQIHALKLILTPEIKQIFIDGGFSKNHFFLKGLKEAFPEIQFYAAELAQASSLGAALAIHDKWNDKTMPTDLISLLKV
ncbi:FGGY-family carbohydrate kinase [Jiulongibacter sediminis]|uniref:FGGY-family carbohydrate kinase n=1 Tax=Jiulongibacter sediminis TaxID=1605367 RepID=UPI0026EB74F1|nr:FGGY family carbohydrate kinase [Jiulongibacter sediminis]